MNRQLRVLLIVGLASVTGFACGDDDPSDPNSDPASPSIPPLTCAEANRAATGTTLADVGADTTLSGVVNVPGIRIVHTGGTITVDAGTVFLMSAGSSLKFGFGGAVGTVQMNGTAERPILFCGVTGTAGTYGNIDFGPALTTDSYLRNVRFEDGGDANGPGNPSTNGPDSALRFAGATEFELTNVVVRNAQGIGINASSFDPTSANLTVTEVTGRPMHLRTANAVSNLPSGQYTGNGEDLIEIDGVQNDAATITFGDPGVPYIQVVNRVNFAVENHVVNFDPGVEYRFIADAFMVVGFGNSVGTLNVNGTAANPVIFTSAAATPAAGDWNGLQLGPQIQTGSSIQNAEFRFGGKAPTGDCGAENANLSFAGVNDTDVAVSGVTFADSAGFGVCVQDGRQTINGDSDAAAGARGSGNIFTNNAAGDVSVANPRN